MTPDPPGSPPVSDRRDRATRELLLWFGRLLVWGTVVLGALFIGGPLALFGLAGVALLLAVALVALGALAWRRAMLPLALCAGAVAVPAAVVEAQPDRIDPSHGLLLAVPRTPSEVHREYRRGHGMVVVDLRKLHADAGQVIRFAARSDTAPVVVALPQGRCFNLKVRTHALGSDRSVLPSVALMPASAIGVVPTNDAVSDMVGAFREADWPGTNGGTLPSNLVAFGRTQRVVSPPTTGDVAPVGTWASVAPNPATAPSLELDLASPTNIYLRDYPANVGVAYDSYSGAAPPGQQTSDIHWPEQVDLPPSPEQLNAGDAWGADGGSRFHVARERVLWRRWFRRVAAAAAQKSRAAAGSCATARARDTYWTGVGYGGQIGGDTTVHEFDVNGNGRIRVYGTDAGSGSLALRDETTVARFAGPTASPRGNGGSR